MPAIIEEIPEPLRPEVTAALDWLNAQGGPARSFTAVVDPDATLASRESGASEYELGIVVCQDSSCVRERIAVRPIGEGFEFSLVESPPTARRTDGKLDPPAELDPAPGALVGWIEEQLKHHEFIVLLYYRGLW
jgi:hypothetical protein